jgi:signal transduction histidine kinase
MNEAIPLSPDAAVPERADVRHDGEVRSEALQLAFANLRVSQAVALANGAVLGAVLSFVIDRQPLTLWLAALTAITLARLLLGALFRRASVQARESDGWRSWFIVGAAASGLVWGTAALSLYAPDSIVHQVFVAFVVGGMVVGSVVALAPTFPAFVLFCACALVPHIVRYALHGDPVHDAMAAMTAIFLVAMLLLGRRIHRTLIELIELRFRNRELIDYLTHNRRELVAANADLVAAREKLTRANEALESRVAERTAALQAADRRKDEFLAVLSHELRNPLAPIRNSVFILSQVDAASEQGLRAREIIDRQTQHIARLVDDLLDVTRIARGKIELRRGRADLCELVARTVQDYMPLFQQFGVRLQLRTPHRPVWSNIDSTRVAQLVGNLLQNAANFTAAEGEVRISLEVRERWAEIRVADTGAGIAPELLPQLFEPFMQGKQSLARTVGGLGLGLALVKGVVELHGGDVRVESEGPGRGAQFTVRLPLDDDAVASPAASAQSAHAAAPRRVLVVDDNADAADSLAQLVRLFGHAAEVAYDGAAAVEKALAHPPDVLLCDLGLPGLTGYEVAGAVHAAHPRMRLIAVSGYAQPEDITRAREAGFEQHRAKPLDPDAVRRLLV